ncbi:NADP-dependent isocitrate dehydrogenase [Thiothrix lacustris]|uniref:Isocitrate dehydrogenase [NADP] n=1 Tax=Thiothrix lacustris TaxID=525917 RepID=A0ABY9MUX0_9GAMM|nr:NADP-dependent isocitrate dehydrogenase [Thiothrix lacustris]WML92438.1 NADP-dependent isocitrate dehydrogenase [Thiothrix lacustris]
MQNPTIIYTLTDEAPLLATCSLLPIIKTFTATAGIEVTQSDISVATRILAEFPDYLSEAQRVPDNLAELGRLTHESDTNIIKLPNISASVPQLKAAVSELRAKGFMIPKYPENPQTEAELQLASRYSKILGSAVNPVLREGNSDRRAPPAVKRYAQKNPHSMGKWSPASRTHVSYMRRGDFYSSEQSVVMEQDGAVRMELVTPDGEVQVLKTIPLLAGEIIDSMYMSKQALCAFYAEQLADAKDSGILFSLHVKATMMKVSHPIVFGHAVKVFFKDLFAKYGELFEQLGVNPNNGMSSVLEKIQSLPAEIRVEIEKEIADGYAQQPELAMVDSDKGITNLHAPNDVIVDASMPAMIRNGGKMWGVDGKLKETKAVIPESTFARIYQEMIGFCKTNGAFDPTTMGSVPNVGLMAQKAEEYGSHDKTFEITTPGTARVVDEQGKVLMQHQVETGDIWRTCQTKDAAVRDWVKLAVKRARLSNTPAVFWLDPYRPHEAQLIQKVELYLQDHDLNGVEIHIMSQVRAMRFTLERIIRGMDTISVTGNILRDYLTDLFPIMELGTSAKMLSIVPMMEGGSMFETGAGGSAPKHVQQLVAENHLRWDSLGEFLAMASSLEEVSIKTGNPQAQILATTLDQATGKLLDNRKSPAARVGQLDTRGSHFYLALYWAEALAAQTQDAGLAARFAPLAKALADNEQVIIAELNAVQGQPVDLDGYYCADMDKMTAVMRPSATFNAVLATV